MVNCDRIHMVAKRTMGGCGVGWQRGREEQAGCYEGEDRARQDHSDKKSLEHEIVFLSLSGFQDGLKSHKGRPDFL